MNSYLCVSLINNIKLKIKFKKSGELWWVGDTVCDSDLICQHSSTPPSILHPFTGGTQGTALINMIWWNKPLCLLLWAHPSLWPSGAHWSSCHLHSPLHRLSICLSVSLCGTKRERESEWGIPHAPPNSFFSFSILLVILRAIFFSFFSLRGGACWLQSSGSSGSSSVVTALSPRSMLKRVRAGPELLVLGGVRF